MKTNHTRKAAIIRYISGLVIAVFLITAFSLIFVWILSIRYGRVSGISDEAVSLSTVIQGTWGVAATAASAFFTYYLGMIAIDIAKEAMKISRNSLSISFWEQQKETWKDVEAELNNSMALLKEIKNTRDELNFKWNEFFRNGTNKQINITAKPIVHLAAYLKDNNAYKNKIDKQKIAGNEEVLAKEITENIIDVYKKYINTHAINYYSFLECNLGAITPKLIFGNDYKFYCGDEKLLYYFAVNSYKSLSTPEIDTILSRVRLYVKAVADFLKLIERESIAYYNIEAMTDRNHVSYIEGHKEYLTCLNEDFSGKDSALRASISKTKEILKYHHDNLNNAKSDTYKLYIFKFCVAMMLCNLLEVNEEDRLDITLSICMYLDIDNLSYDNIFCQNADVINTVNLLERIYENIDMAILSLPAVRHECQLAKELDKPISTYIKTNSRHKVDFYEISKSLSMKYYSNIESVDKYFRDNQPS